MLVYSRISFIFSKFKRAELLFIILVKGQFYRPPMIVKIRRRIQKIFMLALQAQNRHLDLASISQPYLTYLQYFHKIFVRDKNEVEGWGVDVTVSYIFYKSSFNRIPFFYTDPNRVSNLDADPEMGVLVQQKLKAT